MAGTSDNEGDIDPELLAADGNDVIEGVDPPTDEELQKARHAHPG